MQKIIQITDTHLVSPGKTVLGLDPVARLQDVVRSINENHNDAALCVLTGDLTDQGEEEAYGLLRNCLSTLQIPYRLLLGNHDARAPFLTVFPETETDDDGFVQATAEVGENVCIFLDTLDESRPAAGFLCPRRLSWFDEQVAASAGRRVIVFMHHPPLSIGLRWFEGMLLENGTQVVDRLARHSGIAHIVFGHVHVNTGGAWRGVSYSASRGTCHKILAAPADDRADYVDQGPAYDILVLGEEGICVHSIDPAGPNHVIAREHPTADGRGSFEPIGRNGASRWM